MRPRDKFDSKEDKEFADFPHENLHAFEFYAGDVASFSYTNKPSITLIDVLADFRDPIREDFSTKGFNTTFGEIIQIEFSGQIYVSRGDFLKVTLPILTVQMKFTSPILRELISQPRNIANPEKALIISVYDRAPEKGKQSPHRATYHSTQYTQISNIWVKENHMS